MDAATLSRYETWRYFRNFIVGLFTLCGCYLQLDIDTDSNTNGSNSNSYETQEKLLDNVAFYITDNLISYIRYTQVQSTTNNTSNTTTTYLNRTTNTNTNTRVSFDDIAEWYSGGVDGSTSTNTNPPLPFKYGHEIINWLELLDISKWVKLISK